MKRAVATLNLPEFKIKELHNKGYLFCEDINLETIKSDIGITLEEWKNLTESPETKTALELIEDDIISSHIVTFSSSLDELLDGGVPVKMITEVTGLPGTGKTQFCLQLCVSVQLPDCFGGIQGNCVYVDTNFGFTPQRLLEMTKGCISYCQEVANTYNSFEMFETLKTLTEDSFLKGVHYVHAVKFIQLLSVINVLKKLLEKNSNIKLIIIDSITDAVKNTNLEYFERIKLIYSFLSDLQKMAQIYKFAVSSKLLVVLKAIACKMAPKLKIVITNDMTTKFNEKGESYEDTCLGDSFAHRINSRIKLERISDDIFNAKLIKNILKPVSSARFQIVEAGIRDTQ